MHLPLASCLRSLSCRSSHFYSEYQLTVLYYLALQQQPPLPPRPAGLLLRLLLLLAAAAAADSSSAGGGGGGHVISKQLQLKSRQCAASINIYIHIKVRTVSYCHTPTCSYTSLWLAIAIDSQTHVVYTTLMISSSASFFLFLTGTLTHTNIVYTHSHPPTHTCTHIMGAAQISSAQLSSASPACFRTTSCCSSSVSFALISSYSFLFLPVVSISLSSLASQWFQMIYMQKLF